MSISYNPKDAASTWPDGDYDGVIATVTEEVSKNTGQNMWKTGVKVYNNAGEERTLTEYFTVGKGLFRLKQLAQAHGQLSAFEAAKFTPFDVVDKRMTVTLGTQEAQGNFAEKNVVAKFSAAKGGVKPAARKPAVAGVSSGEQVFKEDDIPFAPNKA